MSTIYSRCYALSKEKKIEFMPNHGQMMQIGIRVAKLFRFKYRDRWKSPIKIQAPEYVGDFKIAYYPAEFTHEIDSIIGEYFRQLSNPTKRGARKRVPVKRA